MSTALHSASGNGVLSKSAQRVEKVFVTPEIATQWLAKNPRNRTLVKTHLIALEQVLKRGEWVLNGDTIRFGVDGMLKDGQHRLTACVNTGIGFWTYVAYGLEDDAFDTIDTMARPRKVSDVLSINGVQNACATAACVKLIWAFVRTGQFYDGGYGAEGYSPKVCRDILQKKPSISSFVHMGTNSGRVFPSRSLLSALGYVFSSVDETLATEMFTVMSEGSNVIERPFNVLRESLIDRRVHSSRIGLRAIAFMAIRTWNSELSGKWVKRVYYKHTEEFPVISGVNYERLEDLI